MRDREAWVALPCEGVAVAAATALQIKRVGTGFNKCLGHGGACDKERKAMSGPAVRRPFKRKTVPPVTGLAHRELQLTGKHHEVLAQFLTSLLPLCNCPDSHSPRQSCDQRLGVRQSLRRTVRHHCTACQYASTRSRPSARVDTTRVRSRPQLRTRATYTSPCRTTLPTHTKCMCRYAASSPSIHRHLSPSGSMPAVSACQSQGLSPYQVAVAARSLRVLWITLACR